VKGFWIWGPTGTGKTYCCEFLIPDKYFIPKDENWYGYRGEQLLILNEFKGEYTPGRLIDILEGRQMNVKFGQKQLPRCVLVVTSNFSIEQCYHKLAAKGDS
jgi:hypothetical protein